MTTLINKNVELQQVIDYFGILFDKDDFVWTANYIKTQHSSKARAEVIETMFLKDYQEGSFLAVNGCAQSGINKQSDNVNTLRNFLIEFDKMTLETQIPFMESLGIPYSACVYSGGKSYHFIISLDDPVNNILEYKDIFYRIHHLCNEQNDKACSDPARFTRFPNGKRKGRVQSVIKLNKRVSKVELLARLNTTEFLESYKKTKWYDSFIEISDFAADSVLGDRARASVIEKIEWYANSYLGKFWTPGKKMFIQCPVCKTEGRDNHQDNLHVHGSKALFHCFADPDHGEKILPAIYQLMKDSDFFEDDKITEVQAAGQLVDWSSFNE